MARVVVDRHFQNMQRLICVFGEDMLKTFVLADMLKPDDLNNILHPTKCHRFQKCRLPEEVGFQSSHHTCLILSSQETFTPFL